MQEIKGKRFLFIGTGFYDYEENIKKYMEDRGAEVFYFVTTKKNILLRLLKRIGLKTSFYYEKSINYYLDKAPLKIDGIIIIRGENFTQGVIDKIYTKYPSTKKVVYFWDSLKRMNNYEIILKNFENILTFDRVDAIKYNLIFRPLYFRIIDDTIKRNVKYNISFVGGIHSTRLDIVRKLKTQMIDNGLSFKFLLWISPGSYFIHRYLTKKICKEDNDLFCFHPIPYSAYIDLSLSSNVILDISHPQQNGLTMRTIESIGMKKKVLTTNTDIINYNFPQKYIQLIKADDYICDIDFLKECVECDYDVKPYTLDSFLSALLSYL